MSKIYLAENLFFDWSYDLDSSPPGNCDVTRPIVGVKVRVQSQKCVQ